MNITVQDRIIDFIEFNYRQPSGYNDDEKIRVNAVIEQLLVEDKETLKEELQKYKELAKDAKVLANYYGNRMDSGGTAREFKDKHKELLNENK